MNTNEFLQKTQDTRRNSGIAQVRNPVQLGDGLFISIQASKFHYCTPRVDNAPAYTTVEISFQGAVPAELDSYRDLPSESVFGFVPVELVDKLVEQHGGFLPTFTKPATLPKGDLSTFGGLIGHTLSGVKNNDNEELIFTLMTGERYMLYHRQDCCESVRIEDIVGDLDALIGSPIMMAEEASNGKEEDDDGYSTHTWTFYKLATVKGYVTIRWFGSSNGYYSESVDWTKVS
jgi:hypothetical protein